MQNKVDKIIEDVKTALEAAKNEAHFSAQDLLEELAPLVRSYFFVNTEFDGQVINITCFNGQKFKVIAEEI